VCEYVSFVCEYVSFVCHTQTHKSRLLSRLFCDRSFFCFHVIQDNISLLCVNTSLVTPLLWVFASFVCEYVSFVCEYVSFVCEYVSFACEHVSFVCEYVSCYASFVGFRSMESQHTSAALQESFVCE